MKLGRPKPICLSDNEKLLFEQIDFEVELRSHAVTLAMIAAAKTLTTSLLERAAVPEIRRWYFTKPEFNRAGRGKRSHKNVFESNGTRGDAIFEHPHFLKYLRYFVSGPDLPPATIDGFCAIVDRDGGYVTSGTRGMLCRYIRSEIRTKPLGLNAPEEFFKLSIEVGMDAGEANLIRKVAMRAAR